MFNINSVIFMKHEKIKKICKECNHEYMVHYYRKDKSNFCSFKCSNNNKIGKPSWNKGTKGIMKYNKTSFNKGMIPYNKGLKHKLKTRIKISLTKKPRKEFDGFIETENKRKRKSLEYISWRTNIFKKYNYMCVICNGKEESINAHHLENFSKNKNNYNLDNGVCLCKKHHLDFHKKYGFHNNNEEQFIDYFGEKLLEKYIARNLDTLAGTDLLVSVSVS